MTFVIHSLHKDRRNLVCIPAHRAPFLYLGAAAVSAVMAMCVWSLLIGASSAYGQQPTILTVDFGVPGKPALQRASGFLNSITAHEPEDRYLQPLKPRLFRLNPFDALNVELHHRLTAFGAVIQCVISDASGAYGI